LTRIVWLTRHQLSSFRGNYSAFEDQRAAEMAEQGALQDKINTFKIYPVLSIGFTIGF